MLSIAILANYKQVKGILRKYFVHEAVLFHLPKVTIMHNSQVSSPWNELKLQQSQCRKTKLEATSKHCRRK